MMRRGTRACFLLVLLHVAAVAYAQEPVDLIETQVLRVFATRNAGYYHKPWKSPDFDDVRASGFFFRDEENFPNCRGLILTNAHVVSQAQSIRVSNGREKRHYRVRVVGVCNAADFAVLCMEPEDYKAMERRNGPIVPLELGNSDALRVGDRVWGWGYPLGGERISKSEQGEISRIEVNRYAYSRESWLMVQASLQQNRGNSGGPVLKNGKVVGVAFQGIQGGDRINYFIPINLVRHLIPFLDKQDQIPRWRYVIQNLFPRLKEYYNLDPEQGGVLLTYLVPGGGPWAFGLRVNDILLEIDGYAIDNFGEIYYPPLGQKIYFGEVLNRKRVGDDLNIKAIREGKPMDLAGKVTPGLPPLVPRIFTTANYFIFSGIGFVELTLNCIENLGKTGEVFRAKYLSEFPKRPYEKIVIISEIFPEYGLVDATRFLNRVEKLDGEDVLNIEQLHNAIQSRVAQGKKRAILQLAHNVQLPLDLERAATLDKEIRDTYGILYMQTPGGFSR